MQQFTSDYNGDHKSIYLVPIGDIHFGNKYYNPKYLDAVLKFVRKHRNRCRILLMGDMLEVATKTSVGRSVYDESYPTQKQFEKAIEVFKPYADLIDLVVDGNHEERIIRDTSFEIVEEFCHRIGRPEVYARFSGILNVKLSKGMSYSVFAWHGATGGTKEAGAINALLSMRERVMAHTYFMGHTHKLLSFTRKVYLPDTSEQEPTIMEQMFVNTGSALDYGGYGEQKGFPINRVGYGVLQIFTDGRKQVFHCVEDLIDDSEV